MASVGLKYPVYAVVSNETAGSAITYGTGKVMAMAIAASITQNRRDNPLYADDIKAENDKGLTDYSISLEIDDISNDVRSELLGEVKILGDDNAYAVTEASSPYVGFGYINVRMKNGVTKTEAYWFHKVQFAMDAEEATTKRDTIEWGTPKLNGTGFGVYVDNTGVAQHYVHAEFATEAAAKAWLNNKANIA